MRNVKIANSWVELTVVHQPRFGAAFGRKELFRIAAIVGIAPLPRGTNQPEPSWKTAIKIAGIGEVLVVESAEEISAVCGVDLVPIGESEEPAILAEPIEVLELSVRPTKFLADMGIKTVGDLTRACPSDLLSKKGFGVSALQEVQRALLGHGLVMRHDPVGAPEEANANAG